MKVSYMYTCIYMYIYMYLGLHFSSVWCRKQLIFTRAAELSLLNNSLLRDPDDYFFQFMYY